MVNEEKLIIYGPVPSRRLGQSLGINNIPPKKCTYSCVYCQLGRTHNMQVERREFYKSEEIMRAVEKKVKDVRGKGNPTDYLTYVSDGEPTLDINIGAEIKMLNTLGIKIAVITNASLLWQENVRNELNNADLVSLKIDAVSENIWRKINRPDQSLNIQKILKGISEFSYSYNGNLITETMLIHNINNEINELNKIASIISKLQSKKSYISIPIRPPSEKWVKTTTESELNTAYQIFKERGINVEFLTGYEGNAFSSTGNLKDDLLSITAVHPMREEGVNELVKNTRGSWDTVNKLISEKRIIELEHKNKKFYLRKFSKYDAN